MVRPDMLACRPHWYSLPRSLRNRVWAAWANGEGAGSPEHTAAVADAIAFLQDSGEQSRTKS